MPMRRTGAFLAWTIVVAACGARTGLPGGGLDEAVDASDARADARDAARDAPKDAPLDAPKDAPKDAPLDAPSKLGCEDAGVTYIYVLTSDDHLYSFDPPAAAFTHIGLLACPGPNGMSTNSMAVDRKGIAYVSMSDGSLYRVSTANASCRSTSFVAGQGGWGKYGMGFATEGMGPTEKLYVAEASYMRPSLGLATIDTTSFAFGFIGPFSQTLGDAVELTGTGDGRLYGFFLATPGPGGYLAELDKSNASVLSVTGLPIGSMNAAFAFAFWGGDFYFFIANGGNGSATTVTRYRPTDKSLVDVATLPSAVVGAGVSTCAPSQ